MSYIKSLRRWDKKGTWVVHKTCYYEERATGSGWWRVYGVIIDIGGYHTVCGLCGHKFPPIDSINFKAIKLK